MSELKTIVKSSPLRFKKVRQAINYAIDKEKLLAECNHLLG